MTMLKVRGMAMLAIALSLVCPALAGQPVTPPVKVGMSLAEVRATVQAAGWYPPSAPYCKAGNIESETGYCGLIPATILNAAPEARAAASDYPAVQMCYKDHHGRGFRALFRYKYGDGHNEPSPASLQLVSWDMASANCLSE